MQESVGPKEAHLVGEFYFKFLTTKLIQSSSFQALSIGLILGLILAPYGKNIGQLLGDTSTNFTVPAFVVNNTSSPEQLKFSYESENPQIPEEPDASYYWAIVFTVLGTILLDFNADNCQTPARAYLLDMIVQEDQGKALSTFTIMAGSGGSLGEWKLFFFLNS